MPGSRTLFWATAWAVLAVGPAYAGSINWTCPCGGETHQFDPRDSAYMQEWTAQHKQAHCGSGGGSDVGSMSTGDPALDVLLPIVQHTSQQLGEAIAREIFGFRDPVEERRLAELRRLEQERLAELERRRQEELERRRRELHARMLRDLVQLGSRGDLSLMGLEPSHPAAGSDVEPLPLLGLDDALERAPRTGADERLRASEETDLRPAGTAFFGLGGGSTSVDTRQPGLRDLRRAAYLAERAHSAGPDRDLWLREAERALEGDTSLLPDAPETFELPDADGKLVDLRRYQRQLEDARADLRTAEQQLAQADEILRATQRAEQRAVETLARMQRESAAPELQEQQRALLAELRNAAERARSARASAEREVEQARALHVWAERGRTQELATLDGSAWEEMREGERRARAQLEAIYRRPMDVPPPELPGAIARAENGHRAAARLAELERTLDAMPDAERRTLDDTLQEAQRHAELMQHYDRIINAHTRARVQNMQSLEALPGAARREVHALASESVDLLGGSVGRFREAGQQLLADPSFREAARALSLEGKLADAGSLRSEAAALGEAVRSGEISFDDAAKLSQRASGWATEIAGDLEALRRSHPDLARRLAGPIGSWIQSAHGVARATEHTLALLDLHQQAELLDAELGQSARQLRAVKGRYEQQVDCFNQARGKLEEAIAARAEVRHTSPH